ncbi:GNAT family N-acetyltransferase [Tessaracoccus coleopterorum]|uniref:GNAT family N-acetyltransferase n=1 Tax=Tessaracoccus coleopterorum TaxID=2714950 RepID=UPI001E406D89|nr:GNAT family protein [Tessaracoccus coleopterorum]
MSNDDGLVPELPQWMPRLDGGSVILRAFEERDADLVMSVASDPLIPLITTVPRGGTRDEALAFLERQHSRLAEGTGYSFAIADAATDEAVGQIGLWTRDIATGRASTGYWIAPQFRRHGYARAALSALTAWVLGLDQVHRLQLYVEPWNEGSWRTAEACGYLREGLLRSWQTVGRVPRDMYVYGVVNERASGSAGCRNMTEVRWVAVRDVQVPADVERLLATVPEWFGQPESTAEYVEAARTKETWTVRDATGAVVGVTLVDWHFPHIAEIHLTVVDRGAHGAGWGPRC